MILRFPALPNPPACAPWRRTITVTRTARNDGEEDHEEGDEAAEVEGLLTNSALEAKSGAFGFSFVGERGFVGVAVSRFETEYGLPGHAHAHEDEAHPDEGHDEEHDEGT